MRPKAKTLLERFGFKDPDLVTSEHDAIMLELTLNEDKMLKVLLETVWKDLKKTVGSSCSNLYRPWRSIYDVGQAYCNLALEERYKKHLETAYKRAREENSDFNSETWILHDTDKPIIERIMNIKIKDPDAGYGSGLYINLNENDYSSELCSLNSDNCGMVLQADREECYSLSVHDIIKESLEEETSLLIEPEHVVKNEYNNFIIGFIDFAVFLSQEGTGKSRMRVTSNKRGVYYALIDSLPSSIYIEIKPKITNYGETLRQINMYREFRDGTYIIVTNTNIPRLTKAFEVANIHVYVWENE